VTRFYKIDQLSKSTWRDGTKEERERIVRNNRFHTHNTSFGKQDLATL